MRPAGKAVQRQADILSIQVGWQHLLEIPELKTRNEEEY